MNKAEMTWSDFDAFIVRMTARLLNSNNHFTAVSGVPRGGLPIAVALSHSLGLPFREYSERVAEDDFILMCDDVSDSGDTLARISGQSVGATNYCFLTWHIKEGTKFMPSFYDSIVPKDVWLAYPWEGKNAAMHKDH